MMLWQALRSIARRRAPDDFSGRDGSPSRPGCSPLRAGGRRAGSLKQYSVDFLGGIWPVVQRELREGARRPFNYWLRVGAASAGLIAVVYITAESRNETEKVMGQNLFAGLHVLLIGLICLVVPLMTADCIAREKREGTLGLLFLTPLTAGGIVAGKGLAQALRALTVWVSVAPVLAIPFVMGGIEWADALAFLALEFSVLVLCLAAGLLASTLVRGCGAAFVLALFLGALFAAVFCQLVCFLILAAFHRSSRSISALGFPYYFYLLSGLPTDFFLFPGASLLVQLPPTHSLSLRTGFCG